MVLIYCKVHFSQGTRVLAVCDKALCGKTLKEKGIEFIVSESFYKGEEITVEELKEKLQEFGNVNIVGNKAVGIALQEKLVGKESVIEIAGEKHVQIFKI